MSEPKEVIEAAIKAGLEATDGEWRSDRVKRETAIRTALSRLGITAEGMRELESLRAVVREMELIVKSEAYQLGLAPEGEWGTIPADLHLADKLDKYILRAHKQLHKSESGWTVVKPAESASGSAGGDFSATSPPTEDRPK